MAHRAGYVNIIGLPNVGKSTLLNVVLGEKLVITNPKAQTTRHRILGILNDEDHQLVLSDTPGILEPQYPLQQSMMRAVDEALQDADVLLIMVEVGQDPDNSRGLVDRAVRFEGPKIVLVNKMDTADEPSLLAALEVWSSVFPQAQVVPLSALHGFNVDALRERLKELLPEHPPYFPKDELSDRNTRFFVSEMIREKVLAQYRQELPYSCEVVVNTFEVSDALVRIQADIMVMREGQKGILIGKQGSALRRLGTAARKDIEEFIGVKVFLDLKVKVDPDWRSDKRKLKRYGY
ncbi:MAG: GTPase Era [Flavobacteriales bacterium]|nr:GTPase Era [Flavobacteriales bacterium]